MSARIPEGYVELWTQFNTANDPENMYFALGVQMTSPVVPSQVGTDNLLDAIITAVDDGVSSDYTVGPGHAIWGASGGDIRIDGSTTPNTGVAAAGALPPNCAVLVRKLTAAGGRRGRGRLYMPGLPDSLCNAIGTITAGTVTSLQGDFDSVQTQLLAISGVEDLVLFHDTAPFDPTPITEFVVQTKIATQRRRLRP